MIRSPEIVPSKPALDAPATLEQEQAYINFAYECLDAMRASAVRLRDSKIKERGGTYSHQINRDVFVQTALERIDHLNVGRDSLCFGRTIPVDGDSYYIGRRAVAGPEHEAVVIDWRAPAAEPFYRATGHHPMGLRLRRHFLCEGQELLSIEDEDLTHSGLGAPEVAGAQSLTAALTQARTGQMRDIVATMQAEQDEIVRSDPSGVLAIQGGPGTGKTAVALHRAAYLMFQMRNQIHPESVLVVGPNRLFLRYISGVLPALGETGAVLSTPQGMVSTKPTRTESSESARLKGDARMASVLAKAVSEIPGPLSKTLTIEADGRQLSITPADSMSMISSVRRMEIAHNLGRAHIERLAAGRLYRQYVRAPGKVANSILMTKKEMTSYLDEEPLFSAALNEIWLAPTPQKALDELVSSPALARAARGVLSPAEVGLLTKPEDQTGFTEADLPLLDEFSTLLDGDEERRNYRHIVVDEVQDLSAMQLRMLKRRSSNGSMTVVGDLAQTTGLESRKDWDEILTHLPNRRPPRLCELTVNYRTPSEIMDLAALLLASVKSPRSIRSSGRPPVFMPTQPDKLGEGTAAAMRAVKDQPGTAAVIVPGSLYDHLASALTKASLKFGEAGKHGLSEKITITAVELVKGLEFDYVIVVEPSRIAGESPQGLHALYVALTRATQTLTLVHAEPLPDEMIR